MAKILSILVFQKPFLPLFLLVSCFLQSLIVVGFVISNLPHCSRWPPSTSSCRPYEGYHTFSESVTTTIMFTTRDPFGAIPVKEGSIPVTRSTLNEEDETTFDLSYTLIRPMSLSSRQAAPIVVLHGGPSVPSNYLYPLAKNVPYRSILFFDQLGCGKSDEPHDKQFYSIEQAIDDLEVILKKLSITRFHLYGQSFGGILAFEYLKRKCSRKHEEGAGDEQSCLSAVLSSAPTCVQQVEEEAQRLIDGLDSPELFRETYQCRTTEMPQPLVDAYAVAGSVWRGTTAISNYTATPIEEIASTMPSAMILRGEHDFVTEACCEDWKSLFNSRSVRYKTLKDCSHHGLLENGALYGEILDSFFTEYD